MRKSDEERSLDASCEEGATVNEPVIVPTSFVTGSRVDLVGELVRLTTWEGIGDGAENRLNGRNVMDRLRARIMIRQLQEALAAGDH